MGRHQKLHERLDRLEIGIRDRLVKELRACIDGKRDLLFLAREFRSSNWPLSIGSEMTDDLLTEVEKILSLRRKLGEPTEGCLAHSFRETCRRWADTDDPHRLGARRLAEELVNELERTRHSAL